MQILAKILGSYAAHYLEVSAECPHHRVQHLQQGMWWLVAALHVSLSQAYVNKQGSDHPDHPTHLKVTAVKP